MPSIPGNLDRQALREGVMVCTLIAIPLTVISKAFLDNSSHDGWKTLLFLGALAGFVLGAGQAAWRQERGTPLTHGIVVAAGVYIVVQTAIIVVKLALGSGVRWANLPLPLTFSVVAGVVGGLLGATMTKQGVRPR